MISLSELQEIAKKEIQQMTDQPGRPANMTGTPSPGAQGGPAQGGVGGPSGPQNQGGTTPSAQPAKPATAVTPPASQPGPASGKTPPGGHAAGMTGGSATPAGSSLQGGAPKSQDKSPQAIQAAQKKVQDLEKQLEDAKKELNELGETRQTTAEEDQKADEERAKVLAQTAGLSGDQISISGRPGGPFMIQGVDFGMVPGQIMVGDRMVEVTRWNNRSIKGTMPPDIKPGDVQVKVGEKTYTTKWPPQAPPAGDVMVHLRADQIQAAAVQTRSGVVPPLHPDSNRPMNEAPPGSSTTPVGQKLGDTRK